MSTTARESHSRVTETYEMLLKQGIPLLLGFTYLWNVQGFWRLSRRAEKIKETLGFS